MSGSDWVFGMEVLGLGLEYVRVRVIIFKDFRLFKDLCRVN